ncbi:unnamed protein product [Owenia fusiformis]|uniref:DOMON domain-containing protein n=1 Tax=Owenia fusiformis TaxID=6347 RepID=A0A8S4PZQ0_OWEFU|nr:unnamed protein product [Owenia fusiformis]
MDKIVFEIHAKTTGYVGFGFSPNGDMRYSDMVIGWVRDNGMVELKDRHTLGERVTPIIDHKQDYHLDVGLEEDGWTILRFWRLLDTCDPPYDMKIDDGTMRLIWSMHHEDPTSETDLPYHGGNRGSRSVQLLSQNTKTVNLPADALHLDITLTNVSVPGDSTTYWCQAFKLPKYKKKHHVIGLEANIQPGNEDVVHHVILYACFHEINDSANIDGYAKACYRPNLPENLSLCQSLVFGWANGAEPFYYPSNAGMPIGPGSGFKYIWMEVHWNNPWHQTGRFDTSGMRLTVTPTLRQYDVTVLEVGTMSFNHLVVIPPHAPAFISTGVCAGGCLKEAMRKSGVTGGIKVIGMLMHAHITTTSIVVRHFRNGVELPAISRDDHYDFNFQEMRYLKKEVAILPGDDIAVECTRDTTSRQNITWGSIESRAEMCLAYIAYYPKLKMSQCKSAPRTKDLLSIAGVTEVETEIYQLQGEINVLEPEIWKGRHFTDILSTEVDWTNATVRDEFQRITKNADRISTCRQFPLTFKKFDDKFLPPFNYSDAIQQNTPDNCP